MLCLGAARPFCCSVSVRSPAKQRQKVSCTTPVDAHTCSRLLHVANSTIVWLSTSQTSENVVIGAHNAQQQQVRYVPSTPVARMSGQQLQQAVEGVSTRNSSSISSRRSSVRGNRNSALVSVIDTHYTKPHANQTAERVLYYPALTIAHAKY
jgi:hypothetical protein